MKLRIDYVYIHEGDPAIHGSAHVIANTPIEMLEFEKTARNYLNEKYPGCIFGIYPTTFSDGDINCPGWLVLLYSAIALFFSGLLAAIICTGIMAMIR